MRKAACLLLAISALAVSSPGQSLLVVNQEDRTLSIVDANTAKQVAVIKETIPGEWAHEGRRITGWEDCIPADLRDSGVGRPGLDGSKMLIIDLPTRKVMETVDFGRGVRPHYIVYDPNSKLLYVTTEMAETVTIVDPSSRKIVGAIATGQPQTQMLAVSHDGRFAYTSNVSAGSVSVLDLTSRKSVALIPISSHSQRVSISNDDKLVFTADQTRARLAVIDTAARKIKNWVELPARGYGTAATKARPLLTGGTAFGG